VKPITIPSCTISRLSGSSEIAPSSYEKGLRMGIIGGEAQGFRRTRARGTCEALSKRAPHVDGHESWTDKELADAPGN